MAGSSWEAHVVNGILIVLFGIVIFVFPLVLLSFMSYSFGHWMHQVYLWFHSRRLVHVGQKGSATLVDMRTPAVLGGRANPLLICTLEFTSPDGIVHRRELFKNVDIANMPVVGDHFDIWYDLRRPDDFVMRGTWIGHR